MPLVRSFREHGETPLRGEPWAEARALLAQQGVPIVDLQHVEYDFSIEDIEEPPPPSPTIFTRMTRAKRAAYENRDVQRKSMRELSDSEDSADEAHDDYTEHQDVEEDNRPQ